MFALFTPTPRPATGNFCGLNINLLLFLLDSELNSDYYLSTELNRLGLKYVLNWTELNPEQDQIQDS